jgi:rubredoxin
MPLVDIVSDHEVDYVCVECGYGVALATPPPACPMCHGSEWEQPPWRPFTSLDEYRARFEPPETELFGSRTALVV